MSLFLSLIKPWMMASIYGGGLMENTQQYLRFISFSGMQTGMEITWGKSWFIQMPSSYTPWYFLPILVQSRMPHRSLQTMNSSQVRHPKPLCLQGRYSIRSVTKMDHSLQHWIICTFNLDEIQNGWRHFRLNDLHSTSNHEMDLLEGVGGINVEVGPSPGDPGFSWSAFSNSYNVRWTLDPHNSWKEKIVYHKLTDDIMESWHMSL